MSKQHRNKFGSQFMVWVLAAFIMVIHQISALEVLEVDPPVYQAAASISFGDFDDLRNHRNNCTLALGKYYMMVGCNDGWTAMQSTATFLDARNGRQSAKFTEKISTGRKPGAIRQMSWFSSYIDLDKSDELRVRAYRTQIDQYQLIAFDAGTYNSVTDGIFDSGTVAL